MATTDPNTHHEADYENAPTCEALYHQGHPNYLGRPRCILFTDHRDAIPGREDQHQAVYGFSWPVEAPSAESA